MRQKLTTFPAAANTGSENVKPETGNQNRTGNCRWNGPFYSGNNCGGHNNDGHNNVNNNRNNGNGNNNDNKWSELETGWKHW